MLLYNQLYIMQNVINTNTFDIFLLINEHTCIHNPSELSYISHHFDEKYCCIHQYLHIYMYILLHILSIK